MTGPYRALDNDDLPFDPRWRDCHRLPDAWLVDRLLRPVLRRGPRRLKVAVARYALRFIHCPLDGQCWLRAGHRGGCDWGE